MVSPGRVAISIFGFDIMWYGLLIGLGFMTATLISYKRAPLHNVKPDFIIDLIIWMIPAAIVGARAYYVIFSWDNYAGNWAKIFDIRSGGLAIHGGLILCFLVGYFVCKHYKQSFIGTCDLAAAVIPLAQAIGRWGNFFNEEAHGGPTDLPWAQIIDGVGYHPTFLYESLWCLALSIFLLWFDTKHRKFDGQIICLYMILYSVERFFVEGLRTDSLMTGSLRQAQLISLALIAAGAVLYVFLKKRSENRVVTEEEKNEETEENEEIDKEI
ncbi:MAG: prolipoprotein diacylglyceryl transferase [Firmicutes bacterium]|nr:prolipoprotein diacylglyceryl transferase [Bacillota bacterium]